MSIRVNSCSKKTFGHPCSKQLQLHGRLGVDVPTDGQRLAVEVPFADADDVLAQLRGICRAQCPVLYALQSLPGATGCRLMAGVAVPARRQELGLRVVGPDVGGLAVGEAVLTVGYQVARYALHVVHLTQAAHRVLDEEEAGAERADDAERVAVHLVGPCRPLRLGQERAGGGVLAAVVADGGDAERGAVAACPDDVGPPEVGEV